MPSVQSVKSLNYHLLCLLGSWECYGVLVRTHTVWEHHVLKQMLQAQLLPVCSSQWSPLTLEHLGSRAVCPNEIQLGSIMRQVS